MPMPKPNPASLSFHDLLEGVARGHKLVAQKPNAQLIPTADRLRLGETQLDFINRMANEGRIKSKGETLSIHVQPYDPWSDPVAAREAKERMNRGLLPDDSTLVFTNPMGEKKGAVKIVRQDVGSAKYDDPSQWEKFERSGTNKWNEDKQKYGRLMNFNTMQMPPGAGRAVYSALFDALRAGEDFNWLDQLTGVNQFRRLGNVMSSGLAHGDYKNLPLFEGRPGDIRPLEATHFKPDMDEAHDRALASVLSGHNLDTAKALNVDRLNKYSDDAQGGLLALREMQMAKAYTPDNPSYLKGEPGEHSLVDVAHPMDLDRLKEYVLRARKGAISGPDGGSLVSGFGTGLMGRAGTTEALLRGLQEGRTTEDIVQQLMSYPGASEAIKGRYKKGGLAHAAIEA